MLRRGVARRVNGSGEDAYVVRSISNGGVTHVCIIPPKGSTAPRLEGDFVLVDGEVIAAGSAGTAFAFGAAAEELEVARR